MSCIELALVRRGNTNYNLVLSKIDSLYNCTFTDCYEYPLYLRAVLKDVYKDDYKSVLDDIRRELEKLVDVEEPKELFFKIMRS
jgi:hypothetical protein